MTASRTRGRIDIMIAAIFILFVNTLLTQSPVVLSTVNGQKIPFEWGISTSFAADAVVNSLVGSKVFQMEEASATVETNVKAFPGDLSLRAKGTGLNGILKVREQKITGQFNFLVSKLYAGIYSRNQVMHDRYLETRLFPEAKLTLLPLSLQTYLGGLKASDEFLEKDIPFNAKLKLHGVEKQVSGFARVSGTPMKVTLSAEFPIQLSDFGIRKPIIDGLTLGESVRIEVNGTAIPLN